MTDGTDDIDWRVLDRYLAGEASSADVRLVDAWLAGSRENQVLVRALMRGCAHAPAADVDSAWKAVSARTTSARPIPLRALHSRSVETRRPMAPVYRWILAAAGIGAIVIGTLALRRTADVRQGAQPQAAAAWREINAPRGTRTSAQLPDGSQIVLNAGSSLRYAMGASGEGRHVELHGEAYFVVRHDAANPFVLRANGATIQDVGTHFVVRSYDSSATTIVVSEGSVDVASERTASSRVRVVPGELAIVAPSGAISTKSVDPSRYLAFTEGRLLLDDVTVAEAVLRLARWYDTDIVVHDSTLLTRRLSAEFRDESLGAALDAVALTLGTSVRHEGARVVIGDVTPGRTAR